MRFFLLWSLLTFLALVPMSEAHLGACQAELSAQELALFEGFSLRHFHGIYASGSYWDAERRALYSAGISATEKASPGIYTETIRCLSPDGMTLTTYTCYTKHGAFVYEKKAAQAIVPGVFMSADPLITPREEISADFQIWEWEGDNLKAIVNKSYNLLSSSKISEEILWSAAPPQKAHTPEGRKMVQNAGRFYTAPHRGYMLEHKDSGSNAHSQDFVLRAPLPSGQWEECGTLSIIPGQTALDVQLTQKGIFVIFRDKTLNAHVAHLLPYREITDIALRYDPPQSDRDFAKLTIESRSDKATPADKSHTRQILVRNAKTPPFDEGAEKELWVAAEYADEAALLALLAQGIDINKPSQNGTSILYKTLKWISPHRMSAALALLTRHGADMQSIDPKTKRTLIHNAIIIHPENIPALLAAGAPREQADADGMTPLLCACHWAQWDAMQILLENGANAHAEDAKGRNALHLIAAPTSPTAWDLNDRSAIDCANAIRAFATAGVDVNARDAAGRTPLHAAVLSHMWKGGHPTIVSALLSAGADPTLQDAEGKTPLQYLMETKGGDERTHDLLLPKNELLRQHILHPGAPMLLVHYSRKDSRLEGETCALQGIVWASSVDDVPVGATITRKGLTIDNKTKQVRAADGSAMSTWNELLFSATPAGDGTYLAESETYICAEELLPIESELPLPFNAMRTALEAHMTQENGQHGDVFCAMHSGNTKRLRRCLNSLNDINAPLDDEEPLLMQAVRYVNMSAHPYVLNVLIESGANVNMQNECGFTPLHYSAFFMPSNAALLLSAGAEANHRSTLGITPLMACASHADGATERVEAIRALLAAGANPEDRDAQGRTALDYLTTAAPLCGWPHEGCCGSKEDVEHATRALREGLEQMRRALLGEKP